MENGHHVWILKMYVSGFLDLIVISDELWQYFIQTFKLQVTSSIISNKY